MASPISLLSLVSSQNALLIIAKSISQQNWNAETCLCQGKKKTLPNLKDILSLVNASYKTKNKCIDSAYKIFSLHLLPTAKPQNPDKGKKALGALFLFPEGYGCLHIRLCFKNLLYRVINSLLCYFCLASFFSIIPGFKWKCIPMHKILYFVRLIPEAL